MSPLVSIITVCYNSQKHIEQTIQSVVNQTYAPIEYILVDGKSTDQTVPIIERYARQFPDRIRYISEPDSGIYNAMNKGVRLATGELIGIINSDDWYEPKAVERVVTAYRQFGPAVYHGIQRTWLDEQEAFLIQTHASQLPKGNIEHPTCFVPASFYQTYGLFTEQYRYVSDYELMLRLTKNQVPFISLDAILSNFRMGGASHKAEAVWENLHLWYDKGMLTKSQYQTWLLANKLKIYAKRLLGIR
ncbi:glycosyltransferase involved in cell wall biosynthesis [Larkinella arboricola]|uniref:Glycosyltransferase involved in cell wall biosynthesis n=1 Tax=Larkinella arboricola TaxID=643671 RepID=A0A327WX28_LARAB|nr:glycosyltransferase family 2 protein [Larkinella arboricola]RAJ97703.1 glycosyltransferase involved in cell wall biosynthesis [Larkinella arboricola]